MTLLYKECPLDLEVPGTYALPCWSRAHSKASKAPRSTIVQPNRRTSLSFGTDVVKAKGTWHSTALLWDWVYQRKANAAARSDGTAVGHVQRLLRPGSCWRCVGIRPLGPDANDA